MSRLVGLIKQYLFDVNYSLMLRGLMFYKFFVLLLSSE